MTVQPYLNFDGTCAEAFRFYAKVLGGTIEALMTIGDSPMKDQAPPDTHGRVMHVHMTIGGSVLLGSDSQPGQHTAPTGFNVSVQVPAYAEAERVYTDLAVGGRQTMPFQKTFWSAGFGMLVDRYGIPWMVNCEQPA